MFNSENQGIDFLIENAHKAIPYSCVLLSDKTKGKVIVSGGFDSRLLFTSVKDAKVYKEINLQETLAQVSGILKINMTQPFVYTLTRKRDGTRWLAGLETGNVLEFKGVSKNKPAKCIEGHTTRVVRTEYFEPRPELVLSVSDDLSWALWDSNTTDLIKKVAINAKPNWVESTGCGRVVVSDVEGYLNFYDLKE